MWSTVAFRLFPIKKSFVPCFVTFKTEPRILHNLIHESQEKLQIPVALVEYASRNVQTIRTIWMFHSGINTLLDLIVASFFGRSFHYSTFTSNYVRH